MPRRRPEKGVGPDKAIMIEGRAVFSRLSAAEQMGLAHEIAAIRSAELRRAYPDILSIGFGFKTKRTGRERESLTRQPCVVFEVRRKLKLGTPRHARRVLPRELLTFIGPVEDRKLCVIPTDVKETRSFGRPQPKAGNQGVRGFGIVVALANDPESGAGGAIACSVRMPDGSPAAIGCRHVLSRSLLEEPDVASNARVSATVPGQWLPVGRTTTIRGRLVGAPALSFDAQVLRVLNPSALAQACGRIRFRAYLQNPGQMPSRFFVPTPRLDGAGNRIIVRAEVRDWMQERTIPYPLPRGEVMVAHPLVIHGRTDQPLIDGDSGSPATASAEGDVLLGMYLGGDGQNAYFIPAWQLFHSGNYGRQPPAWSMEN